MLVEVVSGAKCMAQRRACELLLGADETRGIGACGTHQHSECSATQSSTAQLSTMQCNEARARQCGAAQSGAARRSVDTARLGVQRSATSCGTARHGATQHSTAQRSTAQCSTALGMTWCVVEIVEIVENKQHTYKSVIVIFVAQVESTC